MEIKSIKHPYAKLSKALQAVAVKRPSSLAHERGTASSGGVNHRRRLRAANGAHASMVGIVGQPVG
jgi:hypothetical protein